MTTTAFAGQWGPSLLLDGSGKPLANRRLDFVLQGSSTPAVTYADRVKHPLSGADRVRAHVTDARGFAGPLFADPGLYDIVCGGVTTHVTVGYDPAETAGLADINARTASIPSPASDTSGTKAAIDAIRAALQS